MDGVSTYREILIFVAGATPQVITETIYALSQKKPPIYPDEVYVITTSSGKKCIENTLLKRGILDKLAEEYDLKKIPFSSECIIVVKDQAGNELVDIRDKKDNEAIGNLITEFIRQKASDHKVRLHCSLAGGRKTMSFYMGAALQMFGRQWDRLYHVLVSPEFESNPEFFYKPKKDKNIECKLPDGSVKLVSTRYARIELADLPFIRLENKLNLQGKSFEELVEECQKEIDTSSMQSSLVVNLKSRRVHIRDKFVEMSPVLLTIYTAFLRRKIDACKYPDRPYCLECVECFPVLVDLSTRSFLNLIVEDYKTIYGGQSYKAEEFLAKWKNGISVEQLRQYITKINRLLYEGFNDASLLFNCIISRIRKYGSTQYGVRAEKGKIKIE
jgi:CRISPR-associated protein Csx14